MPHSPSAWYRVENGLKSSAKKRLDEIVKNKISSTAFEHAIQVTWHVPGWQYLLSAAIVNEDLVIVDRREKLKIKSQLHVHDLQNPPIPERTSFNWLAPSNRWSRTNSNWRPRKRGAELLAWVVVWASNSSDANHDVTGNGMSCGFWRRAKFVPTDNASNLTRGVVFALGDLANP